MSDSQPQAPTQRQPEPPEAEALEPTDPTSRLRRITAVVLALCVLLVIWHVFADRITPRTSQARVRGLVVPIAPEVAGRIDEVAVQLDQLVERDQVLVRIASDDYQARVDKAEAALRQAGQEIGSDTEDVAGARARLSEAEAKLAYETSRTDRELRLERAGVRSPAQAERARARLAETQASVESARAALESAKAALGADGPDNPRIRAALADLAQAQADLARTTLRAPADGGVTAVAIDVGHYAQPGQPLMTFLSTDESDIWVEAFMRENNLGRIEPGDPVEIALDAAPGRILRGVVISTGFAVDWGRGDAPGELPRPESRTGWLRDPQRFPVRIRFAGDAARGWRREGGQADVIIYTGEHWLLNALGRVWIRLISLLSYVY